MSVNQKLTEISENEKLRLLEIEKSLQLKIRLMPPAPSQQSKKNKEKENKKMLPACARCGENHLGGCMKPQKPK